MTMTDAERKRLRERAEGALSVYDRVQGWHVIHEGKHGVFCSVGNWATLADTIGVVARFAIDADDERGRLVDRVRILEDGVEIAETFQRDAEEASRNWHSSAVQAEAALERTTKAGVDGVNNATARAIRAEAEVARLLQRIDLDSQQWLRAMEATGDQEATVARLREAGNRLQRVMSKACPTIADRRAAIAAWDAALQQSVPTTNSAGSSSRLVDAPDPRSADADRFLPGPVLEGLAQAEPDAPEAMGALTPIPDHGPSGTIRRDEGSRMDADEAADALAHLPMMRRAVERGRVDEGADDGLPFIRTIIDDRKPVALCACGHPVGWRPTHDGRSPGPLPANQRKCSRCACTGLTMPEPRVEQARESEA